MTSTALHSAQTTALPTLQGNPLRVALELGKDLLGAPIRYFDALGDTFATNVLGTKYLMTRDPAWITDILVKQSASFKKDQVTRGVSALAGNGLLTNDDASWRPRRKALQPHFQPAALDALLEPVREETEVALCEWRDGATVDVHATMVSVAMRCALRALFGVTPEQFGSVGAHTRAGMDYFAGVYGTMVPLPLWIPTRVNRRFLRSRRELRTALAQIVAQGRQRGVGNTPLGGLFEAERDGLLNEAEMLDEAMTFLLAGHDPSALTMMFTLGALAAHPEEQAKLHAEVDATQPASAARELGSPSALRNALTESLRLYPASWAIGREARHDVDVLGHLVSKGTQITVHQWAAHRHPAWFSTPDAFVPDRWQGDFASSLPKGLYVPWGTGPRICIGNNFSLLQMMVSLRTVLSRFRLEPVSEFPPPLVASITAQPRDPVLLRVHRR